MKHHRLELLRGRREGGEKKQPKATSSWSPDGGSLSLLREQNQKGRGPSSPVNLAKPRPHTSLLQSDHANCRRGEFSRGFASGSSLSRGCGVGRGCPASRSAPAPPRGWPYWTTSSRTGSTARSCDRPPTAGSSWWPGAGGSNRGP